MTDRAAQSNQPFPVYCWPAAAACCASATSEGTYTSVSRRKAGPYCRPTLLSCSYTCTTSRGTVHRARMRSWLVIMNATSRSDARCDASCTCGPARALRAARARRGAQEAGGRAARAPRRGGREASAPCAACAGTASCRCPAAPRTAPGRPARQQGGATRRCQAVNRRPLRSAPRADAPHPRREAWSVQHQPPVRSGVPCSRAARARGGRPASLAVPRAHLQRFEALGVGAQRRAVRRGVLGAAVGVDRERIGGHGGRGVTPLRPAPLALHHVRRKAVASGTTRTARRAPHAMSGLASPWAALTALPRLAVAAWRLRQARAMRAAAPLPAGGLTDADALEEQYALQQAAATPQVRPAARRITRARRNPWTERCAPLLSGRRGC